MLLFCAIFAAFSLCAASEENSTEVPPFEYKFVRSQKKENEENHAKFLATSRGEHVLCELTHSEKKGTGSVRLSRIIDNSVEDVFVMSTQYTKCKSTATEFSYDRGDVNASAVVNDFRHLPTQKKAHVVLSPPTSDSIDWYVDISWYPPTTYWMLSYNGKSVKITRFLFASNIANRACFVAIEVPVIHLGQGVVSWGTMNMIDNTDNTVDDVRYFDYSQNTAWAAHPNDRLLDLC